MADAPRVASPGVQAPRSRRAARWRVAGLLAGVVLGAALGVIWVLGIERQDPPSGPGAPVVRALYYQALDGAVVALDATTGITRTLLAPPPVLTRLLDVSPGGRQVAYLRTNRPLTATIWYAPLTETLVLAGAGADPQGAERAVPFPDAGLQPYATDFLEDDTLLVRTSTPQRDGSDLYLYDTAHGTTRLLAARILRLFVFRDLGVLLYSQTLTTTGGPNPNLSPRTEGLWALDLRGVRLPQPVATWTLDYGGAGVEAWPAPAHQAIIYSRLLAYPAEGRGQFNTPEWATFALEVLPVRPWNTPTPVATFTSFSAYGGELAPDPGGDAARYYLRWAGPRSTPLPGTPVYSPSSQPFAARWSELRWAGADSAPRLVPLTLPPPLSGPAAFIAGGAVIAAREGRWSPFENPTPLTDTVHLYDPASGRGATITVSTAVLLWPYVYALDDRLLVISAAPAPVRPNAPLIDLQLALGEPTADSWHFRPLGPIPAASNEDLTVYGLTPDRASVLIGLPAPAPAAATPWLVPRNRAPFVTALYRVRLDGGGWQPLGEALPFAVVPYPHD